MTDFIYQNTTKIIFGRTAEEIAAGEMADCKKVLLIYGSGSIKKNGLYDKLTSLLNGNSIPFAEFSGVTANPDISFVREGVKTARQENADFILAVGGGSVIDAAKGIAAGVYYEGDPWDFYSKKHVPKKALPIGSVLTIPAAGSESSLTSVVSNSETKEKNSCSTACFAPKFAALNPENTYTLPAYQTACGAADMAAHMLERYFVNTPCCDLTDRLIEGALQTVIEFAPKVLADPNNYDLRAELMWAGTIAHCNILDTGRESAKGRGGDWSSHNIEHQLSAYYGIAHGAGLAVIFPAWMKFVKNKNPRKLAQLGRRIFGAVGGDMECAEETIVRFEEFFKRIGLPTRLSGLSIGDEFFGEMAEKAVTAKNNNLGVYVHLDKGDVEEIYQIAR